MAIYTTAWVATITVHGWEDDISMIQIVSPNQMTEYEAMTLFNTFYAGKKRADIHEKNVMFPLPFAYDPIGELYKDEDGELCEKDSHRGAWIEVKEVDIGRWR